MDAFINFLQEVDYAFKHLLELWIPETRQEDGFLPSIECNAISELLFNNKILNFSLVWQKK